MRIFLSVMLLISAQALAAQELPLAALGDLTLGYSTVTTTDQLPGPALTAVVRARGGDDFRVLLPSSPQRVVYQVTPGEQVDAGQVIARVAGAEIHHWLLEYDALKERHGVAEARYKKNAPLYRNGTLSAEQWSSIQDGYLALTLELEHMAHFAELLVTVESDSEVLQVVAPESGVVMFDPNNPPQHEGELLFAVIPRTAIRLMVAAPSNKADTLLAVIADDCSLAIEQVEQVAVGYRRHAWTETLPASCRWPLGSTLSVRPQYQGSAMLLSRNAVFQWQQQPHVFIKRQNSLELHPVALLADLPDQYAVVIDATLSDQQVLSASVSAAQGMLMGMGGE